MTDTPKKETALDASPPDAGAKHRGLIGFLSMAAGIVGFLALYWVPIPEGNREPLMLALGLVLGWGSAVVNYEFGSSPSGRAAAQAGIKEGAAK